VVNEFVKPFLHHAGNNTDKLRTAVELIVQTVSSDAGEHNTILATGGGALNTFLMSRLKEELVSKNNTLIIPGKEIVEFKEAILMALMGYLRISNKVNVFSSVTGATSDSIAGCIYTC
jgi:anhydro-N-acetylmuramic acid kinase